MARIGRAGFSVGIETWGPRPEDEEVLDELIEALERCGVRGAVTSAGGVAGGVGATFSVEVAVSDVPDPVSEAVRHGVELFEAACKRAGIDHGGIARVDAMNDLYLERHLEQEPERYAGVGEIARLFGVSRQRVAELRAKPGFPAPVAELSAGPIWKVSSLNLFLRDWERRPGRPRKAGSA